MLTRRSALAGLACWATLVPSSAFSASVAPKPRLRPLRKVFQNGTLNADGTLGWSNGGGDSLHKKFVVDGFRAALSISRLNIDRRAQIMIRNTILREPDGHEIIDLDQRYRGQTLPGAMLSGDGWISVKPVVMTDKWVREEFRARIWYVTVPQVGGSNHRWRVIDPLVCRNLTLVPLDVPIPCICDPEKDAYPRS